MLVVSGANALGSFGAAMPELTALKSRVDQCVQSFPIVSQTDSGASQAATCAMFVGGEAGQDGIRAFEKLTLLEDVDNALLFNIAQTLITNWRNTDLGPKPSSSEVNVRRIAAQKLGEASVFDAVSPTLAVQALSSAGRIESDNKVKLAIVQSLHVLLKNRDIPNTVRTEAITTLKIFADPFIQNDVFVLNAATDALRAVAPKIDIGPITVTPVKTRSKWTIPLVAAGVTAVVAAGGLALFFRHQHATGLSAAGPLRRRAEAALRRQRAR